jgi:hypothetical protein
MSSGGRSGNLQLPDRRSAASSGGDTRPGRSCRCGSHDLKAVRFDVDDPFVVFEKYAKAAERLESPPRTPELSPVGRLMSNASTCSRDPGRRGRNGIGRSREDRRARGVGSSSRTAERAGCRTLRNV